MLFALTTELKQLGPRPFLRLVIHHFEFLGGLPLFTRFPFSVPSPFFLVLVTFRLSISAIIRRIVTRYHYM